MIKKISLFILAFTVGFGLFTSSAKAEECPASGNYADKLRGAMDAILKANPSLANSTNTEENSFDFISLVAKKPPTGFNVTDQVLNGNGNPNSGDLLAIWKKGDAKMERYDVIAAVGAGDRTIESAVTTQFVGLIPLNCTSSGGGKECSCGTSEQNASRQCAVDVYQAGARAKDPIAIGAECRSAVWFQRNTNIALSCSSDFIFRGTPANQWKTWSENQIEKVVRACDGDNVANADKILAALEVVWSSCLPDRKGISCVCQTAEDGENNSCAMFMGEIGPPTITSFTPTKATIGTEVYIEGTHLPDKIELQSSSQKYTLASHVNSTFTGTTFTVDPSVEDGSYTLSVVGINGSATANQKLVITAGGPDFAGRTLPATPTGYPEMGGLLGMILTWSIRLLGISIFIVVFLAGAEWFFNQGNPSMWTGVKTKIQNAIIGAIMLLSAYLILYTINPDLVQGTFELPGITGGNTAPTASPSTSPSTPPTPTSSGTPPEACKQNVGGTASSGCTQATCVDISNYTPTHGCESNGGKCYASSQAAQKIQTLVSRFNALSGGSCSLRISSTIQGPGGPSISGCHKPGSANAGTCADFNVSPHGSCYKFFYQAAKEASVVSFLDEYVPACIPANATGGNIHVNF
ncbi:MAG: hypothetical protein UW46_C0001G0103 [Candidatus Yanofskybacteria bacterium GW2011_GWF1_44_227]|uniref:IPT/TIG domain-containing protein n=1 Tax=Candidatus Yanofskybacteria bacterium GW2011_GWE2_40_11 TaxID=1619033 RepID=A0A0G0QL49_9BACT|nr:MAG: hypothetical protein UT69_C0013G0033 [Candidatus Yanofskybacteria bacterium GW2011_GWE1_40_10]KKR41129.1 MAG: hypothetical protein UT75_C0001G0033 [Candidatus Yanofskybacteria bacterium GW2011_GWE2_40_11]KKT15874.1 MAG: hypothetical protein UV97_C0001G0047 [Candidatus Yanofskybacteria bacterium GW2011_GWF2_43_596]KKT53613.1 MAG: hypothetical protein UW46_C0001G0103 [Candidatus Yanofskybacteria bacterium GW2011_GWF1_44_227]OGN36260.1 MAG: hypothetical protein A2241_00770 [Candidatus Yano